MGHLGGHPHLLHLFHVQQVLGGLLQLFQFLDLDPEGMGQHILLPLVLLQQPGIFTIFFHLFLESLLVGDKVGLRNIGHHADFQVGVIHALLVDSILQKDDNLILVLKITDDVAHIGRKQSRRPH